MSTRAHPPAEGNPPSPDNPTDPSSDVAPAGLGLLLGAAHRTRRRAWEAALADLGLTAPQAAALRAITAHPGIGLRQLSRALVTDVMNARRLSACLVEAGLCENRPDPRDARRRPLHPTPAGLDLAVVVAHRAARSEEDLCRVLGPDIHATVLSGLRRLVDHDPLVSAPEPPPHNNSHEENH